MGYSSVRSILKICFSEGLDLGNMLVANDQESDDYTDDARHEGDAIGSAIALQALVASPFATGLKDAMVVENGAVNKVKDVGGEDGSKRHEAPVLAETMDAKRLGDDGGEDAKEKAVGDPR